MFTILIGFSDNFNNLSTFFKVLLLTKSNRQVYQNKMLAAIFIYELFVRLIGSLPIQMTCTN